MNLNMCVAVCLIIFAAEDTDPENMLHFMIESVAYWS